jgi:hypothetical protein
VADSKKNRGFSKRYLDISSAVGLASFLYRQGGILKLQISSLRNPNKQSLNPELTFFRKFAGFDLTLKSFDWTKQY